MLFISFRKQQGMRTSIVLIEVEYQSWISEFNRGEIKFYFVKYETKVKERFVLQTQKKNI
jgi:hypothetical protein